MFALTPPPCSMADDGDRVIKPSMIRALFQNHNTAATVATAAS